MRSTDPLPCWRLSIATLCLFLASSLFAGSALPRSTPESQGVASKDLQAWIETLDREVEGMHSVMVLRHGSVIAEGWWRPYGPEHPHVLFSLSKSLASTAVGIAVAEGRLNVNDRVLAHFPAEAPAEPGGHLKAMRIRDLLTMTTGHQDEPPTSPAKMSVRSFLAAPVPHKPGTHFKYNTAATFMLSALVQKATGENLLDYLGPRLFEPLGIARPVWDTNFQGIPLGGYGLRLRTEEIARFGQCYLQQGRWNGRVLVSPEWVAEATARQVSNGSDPDSDWDQGYGYQFWRCRNGAYRADGAFGQYCVVLPGQDAVVVVTSGIPNMGRVLDVTWKRLLPAFQPRSLPADPAAADALARRLSQLEVRAAPGAAEAVAGQGVSGIFAFPENPENLRRLGVEQKPGSAQLTLTLQVGDQNYTLRGGHRQWALGRGLVSAGVLAPRAEEVMAGTYGWEDAQTCVIKLCAYETPFHLTYRLTFAGDTVTVRSATQVAFGPTERPVLTGRRVGPSAE